MMNLGNGNGKAVAPGSSVTPEDGQKLQEHHDAMKKKEGFAVPAASESAESEEGQENDVLQDVVVDRRKSFSSVVRDHMKQKRPSSDVTNGNDNVKVQEGVKSNIENEEDEKIKLQMQAAKGDSTVLGYAHSHFSGIDEIKKKRERRREETGHAQAAAAPSKPEDYDPWEHFREKPLPTLSRRTAIDCGVNVIQQEMDRESSMIDRAERLGLTVELAAESINPHDASRLQLLYLHDDEAHRK